MADKTTSALLSAQAKIAADFAKAETRERQNPIMKVGLANQNFLMVNPEDIRSSTKRAVKGYQRIKKTATAATTRTYNFTGDQTDTAEVTLSWVTKTERFAVYWDSSSDNIFNRMEDDMLYGLKESMRIIREAYGSYLLAQLHASRTQVANSTIRNGSFNSTNDAFEIASEVAFFARARSILNQHKYTGNADFIVDSVLDVIGRNIAAQGASNGTNLAYQLQGFNVMAHDTLGIDVATDVYTEGNGLGIALPEKSFAFIPWTAEKYKMGKGNIEDVNGKRFVQRDDTGLPINYMVWAYTIKADGSSNGGTTDDMVTYFQVSADMAVQTAYLSTSNETPIFEFAIVP